MKIKFKDGHEIEFKRFGNILLADSVIWEKTCLDSTEEFDELKAKVADWFAKNAPKKFADKFTARLPKWKDVKHLSFKDKIAHREWKNDQMTQYFLDNEEDDYPICCVIINTNSYFAWFDCHADLSWSNVGSVRLCLEER